MYAPPRVGGLLDGVVSVLEAPFRTASQAIDDVVSATPGGDWIRTAFDQGKTWLGDMANTPAGHLMLMAITGNVALTLQGLQIPGATNLLSTIAPSLAELAWAAPGLAKGQCFTGAYLSMYVERVADLIEILGRMAGVDLTPEVQELLNNNDFLSAVDPTKVAAAKGAAVAAGRPVPSTSDVLAQMGAAPDSLAATFHKRADSVALALTLIFCERVYDVKTFDAATGAQNPLSTPANVPTHLPTGAPGAAMFRPIPTLPGEPSSADVLNAILDAQHGGARDDQLGPLKDQYQTALNHEHDPTYVSSTARQMAQAHGAAYPIASTRLGDLVGAAGTLALATAPLWLTWAYLRWTFRPG